jgi:hypothetical protein
MLVDSRKTKDPKNVNKLRREMAFELTVKKC